MENEALVTALHELISSDPNLGVKLILKRIRADQPDWDVDSGRIREAMRTIANKRICAHCKSDKAPNICTRCNAEYYCSKSCQEENWKYHKKVCRADTWEEQHEKFLERYPQWKDSCSSGSSAPNVTETLESRDAIRKSTPEVAATVPTVTSSRQDETEPEHPCPICLIHPDDMDDVLGGSRCAMCLTCGQFVCRECRPKYEEAGTGTRSHAHTHTYARAQR